jgi:hypothetical protein
MSTILLDGEPFPDSESTTWAELLGVVDQEIQPTGRIVTGVRFDGLDEAAFREPLALEQSLKELATVEIVTGTPASLMEQCVAEAVSSIEPLCAAATDTGERFRAFELETANRCLVELAEGVSTLVAIGGALVLAAREGGEESSEQRASLDAGVAELAGYIDDMVTAQQSQDWITLADVLQYDVEPALRRWEQVLSQFARHGASA